jgi:hypothetical protein
LADINFLPPARGGNPQFGKAADRPFARAPQRYGIKRPPRFPPEITSSNLIEPGQKLAPFQAFTHSSVSVISVAMQKVEGSSPFSRFSKSPAQGSSGFFWHHRLRVEPMLTRCGPRR